MEAKELQTKISIFSRFCETEFSRHSRKVSHGTVRVYVNSLTVSSISNLQLNTQLTGKLKRKDFFDTYNHPVALFRISSVHHESGSNYTVNGSLAIKGKTQSVWFPEY